MEGILGGIFFFCIIEKMPELLTMLSENKIIGVTTVTGGKRTKYRERNMELIENSVN